MKGMSVRKILITTVGMLFLIVALSLVNHFKKQEASQSVKETDKVEIIEESEREEESESKEREIVKVVIPEGFTTLQTIERISESLDIPYEDLLEVIEGLSKEDSKLVNEDVDGVHKVDGVLFPATYEFYSDEDAKKVIMRLVKEMERRTSALTDGQDYSLYELLIIASMIEKEARHSEDRAKISGVIRNRLDIDMLLQIDATILAAVGHKDRVLYKDLEVDSPYNTYKNKGLPPTPIAMPGDESIHAAANPELHDYLYYVADKNTGYHHFSKTYEEHKENIENYLK